MKWGRALRVGQLSAWLLEMLGALKDANGDAALIEIASGEPEEALGYNDDGGAAFGQPEYVKLAEHVLKWIADENASRAELCPKYKPMICKPIDWTATRMLPDPAQPDDGGEAQALDVTDEELERMTPEERAAYRAANIEPRPQLIEVPGEDGGYLRGAMRRSFTQKRSATTGEIHKCSAHLDAVNELQRTAWTLEHRRPVGGAERPRRAADRRR